MENSELAEALDWLRKALTVAESQPIGQLQTGEREEWEEAVQRKRVLLRKLEELNADLNGSRESGSQPARPAQTYRAN